MNAGFFYFSKMKQIFSIALVILSYAALAQNDSTQSADTVKYWKSGGKFGVTFQNVGLSNWSAGGDPSTSFGANFSLFAKYEKGAHQWRNVLEAAYGAQKQGRSSKDNFRKNNDLLLFISRYNRALSDKWSFAVSVDFRTQFDQGYKYFDDDPTKQRERVSDFMAPGYLSPAIGISYRIKDRLELSLSPLANKTTFVLDDSLSNAGAFGVSAGDKVRSQQGWNFTGTYAKEIMKNVKLRSNLLLFGAYDNLGAVDVNWDLFLDMKVNNLITANFTLQTLYDEDIELKDENDNPIGPTLQVRNVLNVGLTFNFGHKEDEK